MTAWQHAVDDSDLVDRVTHWALPQYPFLSEFPMTSRVVQVHDQRWLVILDLVPGGVMVPAVVEAGQPIRHADIELALRYASPRGDHDDAVRRLRRKPER